MEIEMHTLTELDGWQLAKVGDFAELFWDDWERNWACTMLENGLDSLRIGDTLFNVVQSKTKHE